MLGQTQWKEIIRYGFALVRHFSVPEIFPLGVSWRKLGNYDFAFPLAIHWLPIANGCGGSLRKCTKRWTVDHPLLLVPCCNLCPPHIGPIFAVPRTEHPRTKSSYNVFPKRTTMDHFCSYSSGLSSITASENSVMDAIGKYLTPILLILFFFDFCQAALLSFAVTDRNWPLFAQGLKERLSTMDGPERPL